MNCTQAAECISALFDSQSISREVAAHLVDCPECRAQLNEYAEMSAELRDFASAAAPQAIPEGRWRLAEPAAANNWLKKWRETMRIPRFAFGLMVIAIFALSGSLALVKARPGGSGPTFLLTTKYPLKGGVFHCSYKNYSGGLGPTCRGVEELGPVGQLLVSVQPVGREEDRVQLAVKVKYDPSAALAAARSSSDALSKALESVSEEKYWLKPEEPLSIPVASLGNLEVSGQFVDYAPIVPHRPNEPFDPLPEEFRLWNPVLLCNNRILVNMAPLKATDTGNDAAAMLYSPGLGRLVFSSVPVQGGIEGKLQVNQVGFTLDGKDYLLIAGAPITRSDRIWVLYQPGWKPSVSESNPSGDHAMLGANSLQHLLDVK
jgi:hypothetical protein